MRGVVLLFTLVSLVCGDTSGHIAPLLNITDASVTDMKPLFLSPDPVVISQLPVVRRWVADGLFSEQFLVDNMETIWRAKRFQHADTLYYQYNTPLMNVTPDACEQHGCWVEPEDVPGTPTKEFLALIRDKSNGTVYATFPLNPGQISSLVGLDSIVPQRFLGMKGTDVSLWISAADTITTLHYDCPHNVYFQISGKKRWSLFHVDKVAQFAYFPFSGPHNRGVHEKLMAESELEPDYLVDLSPGETLLVPPYTLHRVECIESPCISINVWFEDESHPIRASLDFNDWMVERNSRPLRKALRAAPKAQRVVLLKHLLLSCLAELISGDSDDARRWVENFVVRSFSPLYTRNVMQGCSAPFPSRALRTTPSRNGVP